MLTKKYIRKEVKQWSRLLGWLKEEIIAEALIKNRKLAKKA